VAGGITPTARAHRAAAQAVIYERFADPRLSAADVAGAVGLSERQLSRVFADAGTTVPRQVLARRLEAAHHLLATGTFARTAEVAARCGFTSTTYFTQAFRRHFGVRAGDVRRGKS
jgi:AraC-like DNA-binding protein